MVWVTWYRRLFEDQYGMGGTGLIFKNRTILIWSYNLGLEIIADYIIVMVLVFKIGPVPFVIFYFL
jgi:hypothetical protein